MSSDARTTNPTPEQVLAALDTLRAWFVASSMPTAATPDPIVHATDANLRELAGVTRRQLDDLCRSGAVRGAQRVAGKGWSARVSSIREGHAAAQAARRARRATKASQPANDSEQVSAPPRIDPLRAKGTPRRRTGDPQAA